MRGRIAGRVPQAMGGDKSMTEVVYVSTHGGVYRATLSGDGGVGEHARLIGLDGLGAVRAPVVVDCRDRQRLYAGTVKGGVWRSDDGGATWAPSCHGLVYQEVWSLAQNASTGELYAGTAPATVFRSSDGGDHWEECEALRQGAWRRDWFLHVPPYVPRVRGFALAHGETEVIVGAVEEGWLIVSCDGGENWSNRREGLQVDSHMPALAIDDPTVVMVACCDGMYRSKDGGETFSTVIGFDRPYVTHISTGDDGTHYGVGARGNPDVCRELGRSEPGVFASTDQGLTWRALAAPPQHVQGIPWTSAPIAGQPLSVLTGMTDGSVWLTDDSGRRCRPLVEGLPRVNALAVADAA